MTEAFLNGLVFIGIGGLLLLSIGTVAYTLGEIARAVLVRFKKLRRDR